MRKLLKISNPIHRTAEKIMGLPLDEALNGRVRVIVPKGESEDVSLRFPELLFLAFAFDLVTGDIMTARQLHSELFYKRLKQAIHLFHQFRLSL